MTVSTAAKWPPTPRRRWTPWAADPSIVRNRRKIAAAVNNARIFLTIQEEFGSFSNYLWHFTRGEQVVHRDGLLRASSPLSDAVSRDLKGRGMRFVGSVIIYSYLQAAGIIDDHEPECDFCCGRQRAKEAAFGDRIEALRGRRAERRQPRHGTPCGAAQCCSCQLNSWGERYFCELIA